jgi:hypothetical protein
MLFLKTTVRINVFLCSILLCTTYHIKSSTKTLLRMVVLRKSISGFFVLDFIVHYLLHKIEHKKHCCVRWF